MNEKSSTMFVMMMMTTTMMMMMIQLIVNMVIPKNEPSLMLHDRCGVTHSHLEVHSICPLPHLVIGMPSTAVEVLSTL